MFQKVRTKLGARLIASHVLIVLAPVVLSVTAFGLAVYVQPVPAHTKIRLEESTGKKSSTRHIAAPPKVTRPAPAAPPVAATPPSSSPAPLARAPTRTAGTPKPEPVVTPSPSSSVSGLAPTTPAPPNSPSTTTGYTSTNWSGYLATNAVFTGVSGSWTATSPTGNGATTSADSTWIGIGGVTAGDLIQVGTQNIIAANGQVSTSAFFELLPSVSQPVPGVTVSPGDSMTASLAQVSSGRWIISITDLTNGQSYTSTVSYASSLSSAEWIEEDPSFVSRRLIPFDNFHQAVFTAGLTVANGSSVNIAASTAQPVTMVNSNGQPIAVPSAIGSDGASFSVVP